MKCKDGESSTKTNKPEGKKEPSPIEVKVIGRGALKVEIEDVFNSFRDLVNNLEKENNIKKK